MRRIDLQKINGLTKEQIDSILYYHQIDVAKWKKSLEEQKKSSREVIEYDSLKEVQYWKNKCDALKALLNSKAISEQTLLDFLDVL